MTCPKCISRMERVIFGGVEVDRCTDCHGLFLDEFAKEQLLRMKRSEVIDIGDPELGREFNRVDQILCPRCGALMIRRWTSTSRTSGSSIAKSVAAPFSTPANSVTSNTTPSSTFSATSRSRNASEAGWPATAARPASNTKIISSARTQFDRRAGGGARPGVDESRPGRRVSSIRSRNRDRAPRR
jgi:Zn-finger nucleic acid-binding protein